MSTSYKITDLTELAAVDVADADLLEIVDFDTDSSKKVSIQSLKTVFTASPAGSDTQIQFNDGGSFGASSNLTYDDLTGILSIFATSPISPTIRMQRSGGGALEIKVSNGRMSFGPQSQSPAMYILGQTVGINTQTPGAQLHQTLSTDQVGYRLDLSNGQTSDAFQINSYGNTGGGLYRFTSIGQTLVNATLSGTSNDVFEYNYTSTSGYNSGRIAFGQNYGRATLSINSGASSASIGLQGSQLEIGTQNVGSIDFSTRYFGFQTSLSGGYYNFKDNNGDTILYLENNTKNVGIGTSSPSAKLHTNLLSDQVGYRLDLSNGQTADAFQINSYGNTGGDLFVVDADGNVGIGTTPFGRLWVKTTDANTTSTIALLNTSGWSTILAVTDDNTAATPLQFRASKFHFANSDVLIDDSAYAQTASARLHIKNKTITKVAQRIDLSNGQTADAFQINSYGNTGGDLFRITNSGRIRTNGNIILEHANAIIEFSDASAKGIYSPAYNTGVSNTMVFKNWAGSTRLSFDFSTANNIINIGSLPTSSAGLSAGDLWNDSGTVKIV